jgi:hypothetical protein
MDVKQATDTALGQGENASQAHGGDTCHITVASATATAPSMDSTDGMDPARLLDCVAEEVAHFWQSNEAANLKSAQPNQRELLGVLTFAYARRLFASEEIAQLCQSDPGYKRLCNGHLPFTSELVHFRRHYRPLLVTVLANVMMRAAQENAGGTQSTTTAAFKRQLLCQATARVDMARHLDTGDE